MNWLAQCKDKEIGMGYQVMILVTSFPGGLLLFYAMETVFQVI